MRSNTPRLQAAHKCDRPWGAGVYTVRMRAPLSEGSVPSQRLERLRLRLDGLLEPRQVLVHHPGSARLVVRPSIDAAGGSAGAGARRGKRRRRRARAYARCVIKLSFSRFRARFFPCSAPRLLLAVLPSKCGASAGLPCWGGSLEEERGREERRRDERGEKSREARVTPLASAAAAGRVWAATTRRAATRQRAAAPWRRRAETAASMAASLCS